MILINKAKLIYYCSIKQKSIRELSTDLGINEATFYRKIRGDSDFYRHEIIKIKDLLGLSIDETNEIFFDSKLA